MDRNLQSNNRRNEAKLGGGRQDTREFYTLNEYLGSESSTRRFRKGPSFIQHEFREKVARTICSFCNSRKNGELLIGIHEEGRVRGYYLKAKEEENLHQEFNVAVQDIEPRLLPHQYSIRFIPVCTENLETQGNVRVGYAKVIEICVQGETAFADKFYHIRQSSRVENAIELLGEHGSSKKQGARAQQGTSTDQDTSAEQRTGVEQSTSTEEDTSLEQCSAKQGTSKVQRTGAELGSDEVAGLKPGTEAKKSDKKDQSTQTKPKRSLVCTVS